MVSHCEINFWDILVFLVFLLVSVGVGIVAVLLLRALRFRGRLTGPATTRCPFCAEIVMAEAHICKLSGRDMMISSWERGPRGGNRCRRGLVLTILPRGGHSQERGAERFQSAGWLPVSSAMSAGAARLRGDGAGAPRAGRRPPGCLSPVRVRSGLRSIRATRGPRCAD